MIPATILTALVLLALVNPALLQEPRPGEGHEWSYAGANGPSHWGDLDAKNSACKLGHEQSPIDIRSTQKDEPQPIEFNYRPSPLKIMNNGHTIQIDYAPGSTLSVGGQEYEVLQFHFHQPGEHRVQGRAYDMEMHIVHKDAQGHTAVVAVLMRKGNENPSLQGLWTHLPPAPGPKQRIAQASINVADLLPAGRSYYAFEGSLTTPPCTEGVRWFVLKSPVEISPDQLAVFAQLYPNNARPLQAANERKVEEHP